MSDFGEAVKRCGHKPHSCAWCGQSIYKGETHQHFVGKWRGEWQNWRMHLECYADAEQNDAMEDGFVYGENERPARKVVSDGTG